ncbi:MAG TPA: hypothetical protein VIE68_11305 [Gemmatimonadota bacterium]|jgi:hypothetical protein
MILRLRPVAWILAAALACARGTDKSAPMPAPSGEPTPAAYELDPCVVLSAEDVRDVTGSEPGAPRRVEPVAGGVSYCHWSLAADTSQTLVTVMAIPAPAMSFEEYVEQNRVVMGEGFDEADYERVDGVGESAVWAYGSTLQTWGGDRMVQIQSGVGGPALDREASADLARRALERLESDD